MTWTLAARRRHPLPLQDLCLHPNRLHRFQAAHQHPQAQLPRSPLPPSISPLISQPRLTAPQQEPRMTGFDLVA